MGFAYDSYECLQLPPAVTTAARGSHAGSHVRRPAPRVRQAVPHCCSFYHHSVDIDTLIKIYYLYHSTSCVFAKCWQNYILESICDVFLLAFDLCLLSCFRAAIFRIISKTNILFLALSMVGI